MEQTRSHTVIICVKNIFDNDKNKNKKTQKNKSNVLLFFRVSFVMKIYEDSQRLWSGKGCSQENSSFLYKMITSNNLFQIYLYFGNGQAGLVFWKVTETMLIQICNK